MRDFQEKLHVKSSHLPAGNGESCDVMLRLDLNGLNAQVRAMEGWACQEARRRLRSSQECSCQKGIIIVIIRLSIGIIIITIIIIIIIF